MRGYERGVPVRISPVLRFGDLFEGRNGGYEAVMEVVPDRCEIVCVDPTMRYVAIIHPVLICACLLNERSRKHRPLGMDVCA